MRKTEQLLEMLEHPERYSESQWQEILADDENQRCFRRRYCRRRSHR